MSETPEPRLRGAHQNGRILLLMLACVLVGAAGTAAVMVRLGRFPNLAFGPPTGAPTATPTATLPPTLTPSPTPLPSPTPTATPIPLARITDADQDRYAGDWPSALAGYQAVLDQSSDPALMQAARLGMAQARYNSGDSAGAIDDLKAFLAAYRDSPHVAEAQFLLGDAYRATLQWAPAIEAYQAFLKLRPGAVDSYAQASLGQAAVAEGDYTTAVEALKAAVAAPRQGNTYDLQQQLAEVYAVTGQIDVGSAA